MSIELSNRKAASASATAAWSMCPWLKTRWPNQEAT